MSIKNISLFQWTVYVKPFRNEDMSAYVKKVVQITKCFGILNFYIHIQGEFQAARQLCKQQSHCDQTAIRGQ